MTRARRVSYQTVVVLRCLLDCPIKWRHGYELLERCRLQSGTLYPILLRLQMRNLLERAWRPPQQAGRPPRHVFRLTKLGLKQAKVLLNEYESKTTS
jgi:DNA-binding PadR family transcriptional regulator